MDFEAEDLELFQRKISDRLAELLPPSKKDTQQPAAAESPSSSRNGGDPTHFPVGETLLSIAWLRKLLDVFLCCEAEFKAVLLVGREPSQVVKSPVDRWISELLERDIKAMDICIAVTSGVEAIKFMQTQARIVVSALEERPFTDGQIRRARKALSALQASIVVDEKEHTSKSTDQSRSFGRRSSGVPPKDRLHAPNFRSLSWSVAKNWSAAKQVQSISYNLNPPRGADSTGLALTVYIMSVVLVFVMWTLVAAIPCQDRAGLGTHMVWVPKQSNWASVLWGLQEKIAEEWKRKEKKGSAGLMEEIVNIEKLAQSLVEYADGFQYPMEEEKEAEFATQVAELAEVCRKMDDGLEPLQLQIRELFHRLVKTRAVFLDVLEQAGKLGASNV